MKTIHNFLLVIIMLNCFAASGQQYQIQPGTLLTRWAKQVNPEHTHTGYPRPQLVRSNWENLNGLWDYAVTPKDASQPRSYNGQILVPYPIESALSGVKKSLLPEQNLWYRRTFQHPSLKAGERLLLNFGAVDWEATVFINGQKAGIHRGGYTSFSFDITSLLKAGDNELTVKVYDPTDKGIGPHGKQLLNPQSIYYTPSSGIWQTVWMETVPENYVGSLTITPDIDRSIVTVTVNSAASDPVVLQVNDQTANGQTNIPIIFPLKNAHLWSPADPHLYNLTVSLGKDKVKSYFGMRKVSIGKDSSGMARIFLNNKYLYNLGTLDQGFWPDGLYTAPTDEALAFDIKTIKAMGFNTIRKHIKVEPARWYYWADKLGMLVWQDLVNPNQGLPKGAKEEFETESKEILTQLHNYPSITTWVLFNEKWGQYDQARLSSWIKQTDPSRILNGHSGELLYVNGQLRSPSADPYVNADMTDVHAYPDPMISIKQPGKAQICGEFGGIGVAVPGHQWNELSGWGYVQVKPEELENEYAAMVKKLETLQKQGLSGSIYTQPFDVEGEENGLLSYDREIIKIPVTKLREIHSGLAPQISKANNETFAVDAQDLGTYLGTGHYTKLTKAFDRGERDSAFLRKFILIASAKRDSLKISQLLDAYISIVKAPFSKTNITFITGQACTQADAGFKFLTANADRINKVMESKLYVTLKIREIAEKQIVAPALADKKENPHWDALMAKAQAAYGQLGKEAVSGSAMTYHLDRQDWKNFGKYYSIYYKTAYKRSKYHINNVTWYIFERVTDPEILQVAINTMKYSLENYDKVNYQAYDTYANLLYKVGRKDEAIVWEEKAIRGLPNEKSLQETLEKIRKNIPTWSK